MTVMSKQSQDQSTTSAPQRNATASQGSGSKHTQMLRGMSYDDQVSALTPVQAKESGAARDVQLEANEEAPANVDVTSTDIPGAIYSNTSKTDLNKNSPWMKRLNFALGREYTADVTFSQLVLAGRDIQAPPGKDTGEVKAPAGGDAREWDYIETPTGRVEETGSNSFAIRGGAGEVGAPVTLKYANNGGLNLARLARAAYELVVAKGCTIKGDVIDYKGQTFGLSCAIQMGNAVDAKEARAYGFVGEFDLAWMEEKVVSTIESVAMSTALSRQLGETKESAGDGQQWVNPRAGNTEAFQTEYRDQEIHARTGKPILKEKSGVLPIESDTYSKNQTVKNWGTGKDQQAWVMDPATLAGISQARIAGSWAPGGDWRGHPTYITACPDFTAKLLQCYSGATTHITSKGALAKHLHATITGVGQKLLLAPMKHELIKDQAQQDRVTKANRATIAKAFANKNTVARVLTQLEGMAVPRAEPVVEPPNTPVLGVDPNDEGMVLLRDWGTRD